MSSTATTQTPDLQNYVQGAWRRSATQDYVDVINPATAEVLARTPLSTAAEVDTAVQSAADAFPAWRRTPPGERVQYLFKLKNLLEEHLGELARLITEENGKTLAEAKAELRRGIENVEVACGIPMMMQGYNLEDVTPGVDEMLIRQPLGVVAAIVPFNFPAMISFWFLPYAIACGNTFVLKPSERVPLTMRRIFELVEATGLPRGVVNLVNGGREVVDALCDHPHVRAISFVGSTPVARHVYARAATSGKRMQCQGGAKNHVIVLPDADMELATQIIGDSAFGCAGQRCLAVSVAVTIGDAQKTFRDSISHAASSLRVGNGLTADVQMGPVISKESKQRVESLIATGVAEGATPIVDGRNAKIPNGEGGNFIKPTILDDVPATSKLTHTEIFGPVLSLVHAASIDDAMKFLHNSPYGNQASLFTTSGAAARKFRYEAPAGNVGINIGVAAPMAYFPFSGWKDSFFGILHGQGRDAVEFYTESKIVIERWSRQETRKF
ncbi:MAG TPA: CoA-acylating methylmalonate-semialdehyde dehydrogenase [Candidatus Acidoferrum sp.]|jgi:malonate-semialdehyde dehydrogenase (acetylating)/methylmalonate-semialdehyde dehydrogenase|nr:CoA-acylating methylmalonate-semialdehyde dehydrogenase [Candidatus Acidoferrum sp.]